MDSSIAQAIKQICEEKNISTESVIETIEAALAVAYRKDFGKPDQNIKVEFNSESAQSKVFDVKTVVDISLEEIEEEEQKRQARKEAREEEASTGKKKVPTNDTEETKKPKDEEKPDKKESEEEGVDEDKLVYDPKTMIPLIEAKKDNKKIKVGDEIKTELFPPEAYGRMAAQTAKQVIIQRLREAERETVFKRYKGREGDIINGSIQRVEGRLVFVDLGDAAAIMLPSERVDTENYQAGLRLKFYVVSVSQAPKGPEIAVSRSHPEMVKRLFEFEVPEIATGAVKIKSVSREAGSRTKIAVVSTEPNIDPVGSCVGQRGTRVQTVISELGGEKIDIVEYEEDPVKFIINALAPAKILSVQINDKEKTALAEVKEDQLSLAIGRGGQNVRLAAKLTGWKIDIIKEGETVSATPSKKESKPEEESSDDKEDENKDDNKLDKPAEEKSAQGGSASGGKDDKKEEDTDKEDKDKAMEKKDKPAKKKKEPEEVDERKEKEKEDMPDSKPAKPEVPKKDKSADTPKAKEDSDKK
ncbi:transcription termination factor NusA [Patescibacteria group bacterium]|nr:transcription termination factor NusA [Patescibacteria group bacterium]MBU1890067.1 transcription termination factor NusA [Patescibacteria group bacterium]